MEINKDSTMSEIVQWFQLTYPDLVKHMKNSNHHYDETNLNPHHIEGDVFTHTMMVCKQAENSDFLVKLAALLHDIGKPFTRTVKDNKVRFFQHDPLSAFMSLNVMEQLDLSKQDREILFRIIALHTQYFKQEESVLANSLPINVWNNLKQLAIHDQNGRFHSFINTEKPLTEDEIEKLRRRNTRKLTSDREVVILCGLPASGKSTYVKENLPNHFVVSRDDIIEEIGVGNNYTEKFNTVDQKEVDDLLNKRFELAKKEKLVVVDMTHMSKKSRRKSINKLNAQNDKLICKVFLPSMHEIDIRNITRLKQIPLDVYEKMMLSFYPPDEVEFNEIEWFI